MAGPTKPPGKGIGKPFLGDDDLASELDAWDATFDALHVEEPGTSQPEEQAMAWPAPAATPMIHVQTPPPPKASDFGADPSSTLDHPVFEDHSLEDQMTLDRAQDDNDALIDVEVEVPIAGQRAPEVDTYDSDPAETDFSDVGVQGQPAALGEMLGRHGTVPPIDDLDEPPTRIDVKSGPIRRPSVPDDDDSDDGVFTSASRPAAPAAPDDRSKEDPIAPPPPPAEPRRGPAIVRRTPLQVQPVPPAAPRREQKTPSHGVEVSPHSESTRIQSLEEIEAQAAATRSRHQSKTAPPPVIHDEEDEYEVEIDASNAGATADAAPEPVPETAASRRTAHVVRRGDTPTRPPPGSAPVPMPLGADDGRIAMEIDADEPSDAVAVPAGEEDFSDVAAAVGATDDVIPELPATPVALTPRRPSTPEIERQVGNRTIRPGLSGAINRPAAAARGPVDPLAAFDDEPVALEAPVLQVDDDGTAFGAVPLNKFTDAPATTIDERPPELDDVPPSPRPPADLYARVKTPTSVPPLGQPAHESAVSTLAGETLQGMPVLGAAAQVPRAPSNIPIEIEEPEPEPTLDVDVAVRAWPEQIDPLGPTALDEAAAQALLIYERELATLDEAAASAALRIEAGRLSERLSDPDRARGHYDAALLADPRATAALRGLRRLARAAGDLVEAVQHLDAEIAVAGALERRPLGHYRIDLLMASNEQDLARVAVGEILDSAPSDVRALLAQLELAFLDGRADEFGNALEQLAHAITDHELRAAVQSARGALAAHHNDVAGAANWFAAAAESDPTSLAARIGAVRQAAGQVDGAGAARALIDLAAQVASTDPLTASAAAVRAQQWQGGELGAAAASIAIAGAPQDPLVARLAAETATGGDPMAAAAAYTHWANAGSSAIERAYAAARAAELDPSKGADLWSAALQLDPGDDYGAAQLRTAHVAAESTQASIDVDLAVATADADRERARLRAAYGLIAQGGLDDAITVLQTGRNARPGSLAIAEALGEALAAAGRWSDRARLYAELAAQPGEQLDKEVAQLRSALAWEEAVGAAAAASSDSGGDDDEVQRATAAALEAWEKVLEQGAAAPAAHASAIVLASRLGDREVLAEVLARAQAAERSPWGATSLGLRRARLFAADDASRTESILRELSPGHDDPRRTIALAIGAARRKELDDAAAALDERANLIDGKATAAEVATLRLRAAQLFLDAGDAARATTLLHKVEQALPHLGVVPDLLAAARRRAGDRPTKAPPRRSDAGPAVSSPDAFARIVRDADLAAMHGDAAGALASYQRALEMRPGDPLAAVPLIRVATQLRDPEPISGLALAQLRAAEEANDSAAKASAYEMLAHIDAELRSDGESAQISLASAAQADPSRVDLVHRLERHYASADQIDELIRLRKQELGVVASEHTLDRSALMLDLAGLAARDGRPEAELADLYRGALAVDPKARLALMQLEMIVRRAGFSEELAQLEEKIAEYFDGDPKSQAAFWTRAGETLGEIGKIDEAVARFGRAEAGLPGHVPALEGWRQAALKGQLWIDVAEAANRQAANAQDDRQKAALYHMAGVALMDKALVGEKAMVAFRKALDAEPKHKDSFLRLRILLEEDAHHDDLATLLARRLEVEDAGPARVELHRALAELHRNFLSDRDTAKEHYRFILAAEPNDLRSHAAVADIAWEQGNWQEAADALMARARLEREPEILKTLCFRLGLIYADRLVDVPMAIKAFQRALTYQPDDEATLVRLAELATQAGEWKLALGACERLVKNETDPDRRSTHLHRVAKIFNDGFGDRKRAERALNLALDGAPTNDEALSQLVQFYKDAGDMTSVRVHLNRVTGAMRARVTADPQDGVAYRVISRAMSARANAGVPGSRPIARAAAELADVCGASGEPEQRQLQTSPQPDLAALTKPEADDVLFPRGVQLELRQIFQLLGDRIAKHVGVDLRPYGATRGDRLRAKDNATAAVVQSIATGLGFGDVDVYISQRQPWAMAVEPTSPVSVVIGASVAAAGGDAIRFAAGAALKLAHASLAIPARLGAEELGVLVVGMLRLFQPDFPAPVALDGDQVASQTQKLKRLIPTGLLNELRPYALAVDPQRFDHRGLARDLRIAGLRAGLVASGSILAGLRILAAQAGAGLPGFLADPVAQGLISFALGEDHAVVAR